MFASQRFFSASVAFLGILLIAGCEAPELDTESEQVSSSSSEIQPKDIQQTTEKPEPKETQQATSKSEVAPATSSIDVNKRSQNESSLSGVLKAWESGAKDEAVSTLLHIDWESPTAIGDIPIMSITEKDFVALSRSENEEQQAMAMKLVSNSKAIQRHAFSLAKQAEGAGDDAKAKLYYEAVSRLGNALAEPQRLTVLQMMGKGLVKWTDEKLAAQK